MTLIGTFIKSGKPEAYCTSAQHAKWSASAESYAVRYMWANRLISRAAP